jgi:L-lactate dehydrogenase complex protein LldG
VHLRSRVVDGEPRWAPEKAAMRAMYRAFSSRRAFERAQQAARAGGRRVSRRGRIERLPWPLSGWTSTRDLPEPPGETFRDWWRRERGEPRGSAVDAPRSARGAGSPEIFRSTCRASKNKADRRAGHAGTARDTILNAIRSALADRPPTPEVPRGYRRRSDSTPAEIVSLFAERVSEYRATVRRAAADDLGDALAAMCGEAGARTLAVPRDLPDAWRPPGVELVPDTALSPHELDNLDGALTGCALGIAETGTIVLDGGPGQGRRALTLVPDYHLCVIGEEQVVGLVAEAVERLEPAVREGRPLTFISGPSATSDIELNRVEGVHGPRTLHVVVESVI